MHAISLSALIAAAVAPWTASAVVTAVAVVVVCVGLAYAETKITDAASSWWQSEMAAHVAAKSGDTAAAPETANVVADTVNKKADAAASSQLNFQTPATTIMEKIVDLHHDLMFFIIVVVVFVS